MLIYLVVNLGSSNAVQYMLHVNIAHSQLSHTLQIQLNFHITTFWVIAFTNAFGNLTESRLFNLNMNSFYIFDISVIEDLGSDYGGLYVLIRIDDFFHSWNTLSDLTTKTSFMKGLQSHLGCWLSDARCCHNPDHFSRLNHYLRVLHSQSLKEEV